MERRKQLVAVGRARGNPALIRFVVPLFLGLTACLAQAQSSPTSDPSPQIKQLFDQQQWQSVVNLTANAATPSADMLYYRGIALAQLGQLDEAHAVLLAGHRMDRRDPRFPEELAGIEFKKKRYGKTVSWLELAIKNDPADNYANNFLATVYFLQGNLDAALKYWNRIGKPYIEKVGTPPGLKIQPALLDHAFAFAPASTLSLGDLETSQARVAGLGIFPAYSFRLNSLAGGKFDVDMQAQERDGFGANKWQALLSIFRGAFYQTVYPEYFNLNGEAVNITSLYRWDAQKRRVAATFSGPLWHNPKWRYQVGADLRDENWFIRPSFTGPAPILGAMNLRRGVLTASIQSFASGKLEWSAGGEISRRYYRDVYAGAALTPDLLLTGYQLKQIFQIRYRLWQIPERRFALTSEGRSEVARIWSNPSQSFEKLQAGLSAHWYPQPTGDDYETQLRVRAGDTFGSMPFDELFMLGAERDNDLWLRGHIGTRDGQKGSAPLGKNYFLSNWDLYKNVYDNGLIQIQLGPLVDTGKIFDPSPALATSKWLVDAGAQARIKVLSVSVDFSYGKDLRTGNNAFYATAGR